jgi:hypothetical protein
MQAKEPHYRGTLFSTYLSSFSASAITYIHTHTPELLLSEGHDSEAGPEGLVLHIPTQLD